MPHLCTLPVAGFRKRGGKGDGATSDITAIQAALDACRDACGGTVTFPPGRYLSGTVHLRSKIALWFEAGPELVGARNLNEVRRQLVPRTTAIA